MDGADRLRDMGNFARGLCRDEELEFFGKWGDDDVKEESGEVLGRRWTGGEFWAV